LGYDWSFAEVPMEALLRTKLLAIGFVVAGAVVSLPTHAKADAGAEASADGVDAVAPEDAGKNEETSLPDAGEAPDSETTGPSLDGSEFEDVIVADGGDSTDTGPPEPADTPTAEGSGDLEVDASGGGCSTSCLPHEDLFGASGAMLAPVVLGWARRRRRSAP
jgi:hypothetical protein